jgi:hypothetical protein
LYGNGHISNLGRCRARQDYRTKKEQEENKWQRYQPKKEIGRSTCAQSLY